MNVDVLNCELIWIDGSCYRKLTPISRFSPSQKCRDCGQTPRSCQRCRCRRWSDRVTSYDDEPTCLVSKTKTLSLSNDDSSDGGPKGYFRRTHYVPHRFLPRLCGRKHAFRIQMERDTNTKIMIPQPDSTVDRNRDFSFGRVHIPSITVVDPHNCEKDGFYKKIAELALPKPLQQQ
nr:uncharacterized protein LOC119164908 [Rhipicephalus microplus]